MVITTAGLPDLSHLPVKPAPGISVLEHPALPDILAVAMPGVRHVRRELCPVAPREPLPADEHMLFDPQSGCAARVVVTWSCQEGHSLFAVSSFGPRLLFEELVAIDDEWNRNGRVIADTGRTSRH